MRVRRWSALVGGALLAACQRPVTVSSGGPASAGFRVLSVNDVYVMDTLRDGTAGVARVARLRDSLAALGPVVFTLAGDVLAPSLLTKWYGGAQMVQAFNAARLDVATLGNHEFDISQSQLEARLRESRFRWVSANCTRADGSAFPNVRGWDTVRADGVVVGVVGATLVTRYPKWVRCTEPVAAIRSAADTARRAGAQFILGLTHLPVTADSALLAAVPEIDLIVGGHEHTRQRAAVADGRIVRKADSDARTAVLATVTRSGTRWAVRDTLVSIGRTIGNDPSTEAVVRSWQDSLVRHLGPVRVLATSTDALDVRDSAGRDGEGRFGNLVTDAMRAGTAADVAILNGGALRLDDVIPSGAITNHQLESIFLFPDETRVVVFEVTGAELREQLLHAVQTQVGLGGYLQVSGIRFGYDAARPAAERRIVSLTRDDGRPIGDAERLRLAAVGYLACNGGDGYTLTAQSKLACGALVRAPRTVDLLMAYVAAMPGGQLTQPPIGRVATAVR
ncbi:MAG: 5'-nucleotidase C-terminal domain-containing protein [Gemmatimonadaceae bacterium]